MPSLYKTGLEIQNNGVTIINAPKRMNFSGFTVTKGSHGADAAIVAHHATHETGGSDPISNIPESQVTSLEYDLTERMKGAGFFGDASDGDVTLSVDTTAAREMYYDHLTIPSGITFYPNGYRIYYQWLTLNGTIDYNGDGGGGGQNGTATEYGIAGTGATTTNPCYLPFGLAGTDGGDGEHSGSAPQNTGHNGATTNNSVLNTTIDGAAGGNGGYGPPSSVGHGGGGGGSKGVVNSLSALAGKIYNFLSLILGRVFTSIGVITYNINGTNGGSGGGGTGGTGGGWGGNCGYAGGGAGSGGNAGMIVICAKKIDGTGTICANGGIGGIGGYGGTSNQIVWYGGGGGGAGGGGTGGNGGTIFIFSVDMSGFTGSITAMGGKGGKGGDGGNGGWAKIFFIGETPFIAGLGGSGGSGGDGGNGGAGGIIIVYTYLPTTYTYSVNDGNGGDGGDDDGGRQARGGLGDGFIDSQGVHHDGQNGDGGDSGNGGDGFVGGNALAGKNYLSIDGGDSWVEVSIGANICDVTAMTTVGTNIFVAIKNIYDFGVYLSGDDGATWIHADSGLPISPSIDVLSLVTKDTNIFAGTFANGVYSSSDNGTTWNYIGLDTFDVNKLVVSGDNIFALTSDGLYLSIDDGVIWTKIYNVTVGSLLVSGTTIFIALTMDEDGITKIYRSTDNGGNWTYTGQIPLLVHVLAMLDTTMVAWTFGSLFSSSDNGATWASYPLDSFSTGIPYPYLVVSGSNIFAVSNQGLWLYSGLGDNQRPSNMKEGAMQFLKISGIYMFISRIGGGGISPPKDITREHGQNGDSGTNGTSTGLTGTYMQVQI